MTAPLVVNTPDPYENSLVAWAKSKIAQGGDPDTVWSLAQDKAHAYRASLGSKTDTPPDQMQSSGQRFAGALNTAYQGMTLGAGNKITALIRTALPEKLGGVKGFDYPEALKESTDVIDSYRREHPALAMGMEMGGSIPTVMATGGAGAVSPEAGALMKAWQAAKAGAGYGAVTSGLEAIRPDATVEDVAGKALKGGAIGAVAAPIIGAAGSLLARGAGAIAKRLPGGVGGGLGETLGAGPHGPEEEAADRLRASLQRGGADMTATPSATTSMLDLGSAPTQAVARQARNVPTSTARTSIDDFLQQRAAGAGQRIENALATGTGNMPTDVQRPIEDLIAARSEGAKPLYQAAEAYGEIKDPETVNQIKTLLKNSTFAKAWQRGQTLAELEGAGSAADVPMPKGIAPEVWSTLTPNMKAQFAEKTGAGTAAASSGPTVAQVDAWKKGLDAVIESGRGSENAMARNEARVYRAKLNDVLDRVDQEVPAYAQARDFFRGHSEMAEAADAGANHFAPSTSADYLHRTLPLMSDGEQEAYRANALNAAAQKLRSQGPGFVQKAYGAAADPEYTDVGRKLRMLFPDDASHQQFVQQMTNEASYPETARFFRGQSSTAAQQAEGNQTASTVRDALLAPTSHMAKLRLLTRGIKNVTGLGMPMQPAVADQVGRQVTLTGPELQSALLKMTQDHAVTLANRARIQSLLGNLAVSQPDPR